MAQKGKISDLYDIASIEQQQATVISLVDKFVQKVNDASSNKIGLSNAQKPSDIIDGINKATAAQQQQAAVVTQAISNQQKLSKAIADQSSANDRNAKSVKSNTDEVTKLDTAKQKLATSESKLTKEAALYNVQASQQNKLNQINAVLAAAVPGSLEEAAAKVAKYRNELSILNLTTAAGKQRQQELITAIDQENLFIDKNSDALARQKINIGNYQSAISGLGRSIRGLGGLGQILGSAIGLDPSISFAIHQAGQGLIDLSHALALEKVAKTESAAATATYTASSEASTLTTVANEGAIVSHTAAMEADQVATEGATEATGFFSKALAFLEANPIILVLTALIAAIIAVNEALSNQGEQFKEVEKAAKDYADAIGSSIQNNIDLADLSNKGLKEQLESTKQLLATETSQGITDVRRYELTGKILSLKTQINKNELADIPDVNKKLEEQNLIYDNLLATQTKINDIRERATKVGLVKAVQDTGDRSFLFFGTTLDDADIAKKIKTADDANKASIQSVKANIDKITNLQKESTQNEADTLNNRLDLEKLNAEDRQKIILAEAHFEADIIQNKNAIILSSELATHQQRLAAIKENAEALKNVARAEETNVEVTPGASDADKIIAREQLAEKLGYIDKNGKKVQGTIDAQYQAETLKETQSYNSKILALDNELAQTQIGEKIDADKTIIDSEKSSFEKRLTAAKSFYDDSLTQLTTQRDFELKEADNLPDDGQRAKKRLAIEEKYNADNLKLNKDSQKQIEDITKSHIATLQAIKQSSHDIELTNIQTRYNEELALEDQQYLIKITRDKGNAVKLEQDRIEHENNVQKIQFESQKKQLQADITFAEKQLQIEKDAIIGEPDSDKKTADLAAIGKAESALAALRVKMTGLVAANDLAAYNNNVKNEKSLLDIRIANLQKFVDYSKQAFDIVGSFVAAGVTKELNGIQDQIDLLEKKKAKDIEVAQQTIANAVDQAAAITVINDQAQAQEDLLAIKKRQAQERQAQFEKAANIASIIENTALAVIKTLGDLTLGPGRFAEAIVIGAIGAAQLAVAIATPIPKYAEGTQGHPGGRAIIGERQDKIPEMVHEPSGKTYVVDQPTFFNNLPAGTKVVPMTKSFITSTMTRLPEYKEKSVSDTAEKAMLKVGRDIVGAIKGKKETHLHMPGRHDIYMQDGSKFVKYLKNNL